MARRGVEEAEIEVSEPATAGDAERAVRRKPRAKKESGPRRPIRWLYWLIPVAGVMTAFLVVFSFHQVEAFLIRDARFAVRGPADYGADPEGIQVDGQVRASKAELLRVFESDLNRSLYLFPVAERRRNLLAVDWVKEAAVSRRWPNRVTVRVWERTPVAFAQTEHRDGSSRFYLIDEEGVLLPIPKGEKFENFVVLRGMSEQEPEASRKVRVQQSMHFMKEASTLAGYVTEVNAADPGDLRALMKLDTSLVTVRLGSDDLGKKLRRFVKRFPEIHAARPEARFFDLRMGDRVIAVEGTNHGE